LLLSLGLLIYSTSSMANDWRPPQRGASDVETEDGRQPLNQGPADRPPAAATPVGHRPQGYPCGVLPARAASAAQTPAAWPVAMEMGMTR
jgi:hypothetical protein